jgi:hypothetical protein
MCLPGSIGHLGIAIHKLDIPGNASVSRSAQQHQAYHQKYI